MSMENVASVLQTVGKHSNNGNGGQCELCVKTFHAQKWKIKSPNFAQRQTRATLATTTHIYMCSVSAGRVNGAGNGTTRQPTTKEKSKEKQLFWLKYWCGL